MDRLSSEKILGVSVAVDGLSSCVDAVFQWALGSSSPKWLACANPHSLHTANADKEFCKSLNAADLVTPDGVGVVLASRFLGGEISERITGSDIFYEVSIRMNKKGGMRCFFLGSTEATLAEIRAKMKKEYPNIEVGTYSPPFKPNFSEDENLKMIAAINEFNADVLWVGMTAPKQEKWIYDNISQLDVKFVGAIGAVFDFFTGRVKRSGVTYQKLGLEWLPRLLQEPRRLWRRNLVSNPAFVFEVLAQKYRAKGG
ncbi:MAG: WecB/TagA/CpsF family glycosyltransferase [Pseudomonadota bacterium]